MEKFYRIICESPLGTFVVACFFCPNDGEIWLADNLELLEKRYGIESKFRTLYPYQESEQ